MSLLYTLTNQDNNRVFLGKTNLDKSICRKLLYNALRKEKHYNDLLQHDFKEHTFKLEFHDSEDIVKDFDNYIKDKKLLNPKYGYNIFNDLQNRKGRRKKTDIFSEDLCLLFIFNEDIQFWARFSGLERNTISNRLSNFGLFSDGYYDQTIARYESYYWTALRMLHLGGECMTASQLMDKMNHKYKTSNQLRITPRKISKFFSANEVCKRKEKDKGSVVFCPGCCCDECDCEK